MPSAVGNEANPSVSVEPEVPSEPAALDPNAQVASASEIATESSTVTSNGEASTTSTITTEALATDIAVDEASIISTISTVAGDAFTTYTVVDEASIISTISTDALATDTAVDEIADVTVAEISDTIVYEISDTVVDEVAEAIVDEIAEAIVDEAADIIVEEIAEVIADEIADVTVDGVSDTIVNEIAEAIVDEVAAIDAVVSEEESINDVSISDLTLANPENPQLAELPALETPILDVSETDGEVLVNTIDDLGLNDLSREVTLSLEQPVPEDTNKPVEPEEVSGEPLVNSEAPTATETANETVSTSVSGTLPTIQDAIQTKVSDEDPAVNENTPEADIDAIEDAVAAAADTEAALVVVWPLISDQTVVVYDSVNDISTSGGDPSIDNVASSGEVQASDYVPLFDEIVSKPEPPEEAAESVSIVAIPVLDEGNLGLPIADPVALEIASDVPATVSIVDELDSAAIVDDQTEAGEAVTDQPAQDGALDNPPASLPSASPLDDPSLSEVLDVFESLQTELDQPQQTVSSSVVPEEQPVTSTSASIEPSTTTAQPGKIAKDGDDSTTSLASQPESLLPPASSTTTLASVATTIEGDSTALAASTTAALPSAADAITTAASTTQIVYVTAATATIENTSTYTQFVTETALAQPSSPSEDSLVLEDWEAANPAPQVINAPAPQPQQPPSQQDSQWTPPPQGAGRPQLPSYQDDDDDYISYEQVSGPRQPVNIGNVPRDQEYDEDFISEQQEQWSNEEPQVITYPARRPPQPAQPIYDGGDITYSEGDQTIMQTGKQPPSANDSGQSIGVPEYESNQQSIAD